MQKIASLALCLLLTAAAPLLGIAAAQSAYETTSSVAYNFMISRMRSVQEVSAKSPRLSDIIKKSESHIIINHDPSIHFKAIVKDDQIIIDTFVYVDPKKALDTLPASLEFEHLFKYKLLTAYKRSVDAGQKKIDNNTILVTSKLIPNLIHFRTAINLKHFNDIYQEILKQ